MNYPRNHGDRKISPVGGCEVDREAAAIRETVSSVGTMRNSVPKLESVVLHVSGSQIMVHAKVITCYMLLMAQKLQRTAI
jgi:hypothetical protein